MPSALPDMEQWSVGMGISMYIPELKALCMSFVCVMCVPACACVNETLIKPIYEVADRPVAAWSISKITISINFYKIDMKHHAYPFDNCI